MDPTAQTVGHVESEISDPSPIDEEFFLKDMGILHFNPILEIRIKRLQITCCRGLFLVALHQERCRLHTEDCNL